MTTFLKKLNGYRPDRIRVLIRFAALAFLILGLLACEPGGPTAVGPGGDGDVDGDADGDVDSDADGDTGGPPSSDAVDTGIPRETDPAIICQQENPPSDLCKMVPSGPACGDGAINQPSEACDDGNTLPGDGCTGICVVEPNFLCPEEGKPCVLQIICGNGKVEAGEVCDDGNPNDGDGCDSRCQQDPNYLCTIPGQSCQRTVVCNDGHIGGAETCEDGNTNSGDGCDSDCRREDGWVCPIPGQPCSLKNFCGDGKLSKADGESCDDGNNADGDGCSADCSAMEPGYVCPEPGKQCVNTTKCGDGRVSGDETCDDANTDPADGCDNCAIQPGYECPFPGAKCLAECGDAVLMNNLGEECDDGNTDDGDGCSSTCEWEEGWACTGTPPEYICKKTKCGDGIEEGAEACDDGNNLPGDGCTPECRFEPECNGGVCTSFCGDALVVGEECDDGNTQDGDGCSSSCVIEPGSECKQAPMGPTMVVPIVYRDFKAGHPDFEPSVTGSYDATLGLTKDTLDAEGKPVYGQNGSDSRVGITSEASFAQWYRDIPDTNATVVSTMTLYDNGNGGYVNRWGPDGEQWASTKTVWCANVSEAVDPCVAPYEAADCEELRDQFVDCIVENGAYWGVYVAKTYDGNPLFFPLDDLGISPVDEYSEASIPPDCTDCDIQAGYDVNQTWPMDGGSHNFHFTSEVRYWFKYDAAEQFQLDFTGDDDVWVFLNNRLAVDLGGIHTPVNGTLSLKTPADGAKWGLTDGQVYEIVVFQAERQITSSTYRLTLSGFNSAESDCGPICGDAILSPGEQCDNGDAENVGGYGKCDSECRRGPYCGDGIVLSDINPETSLPYEMCDDGANISPYADGPTEGCSPGCVLPPYCGDQLVQGAYGETCDDGVNDGSYGGCTTDCGLAPWCGDGVIQLKFYEECDDGMNDGTYNTCAPGCKAAPKCGDGIVQEEWGEQCDGTEDCSPTTCRFLGVCGDGNTNEGEQCDDGINDGGYGECAPGCVHGPYCGDGAVESSINPVTNQPYELCDDTVNDGGYGECDKGCVLGPRCGDAVLQPGYEECDYGDGVNGVIGTPGAYCSTACKEIKVVPI